MPNRLTDEKVNAITQAYFECDMVKSKALVKAGYSDNYSRTRGLKLFDNDRVMTAIAKIQAKAAKKTEMSIERIQQMYLEDRELAHKTNQPAAAISAVTGIARLYGFDKDAKVETKQDRELTEHQKEEAREIAKIRLYQVASEGLGA